MEASAYRGRDSLPRALAPSPRLPALSCSFLPSFSSSTPLLQRHHSLSRAARPLTVKSMAPPKGKAKKVVGLVKLTLEAGKATPGPPVGPALGSKGVNIMAFCKEYNAKTADKPRYVIQVEITVYDVSVASN